MVKLEFKAGSTFAYGGVVSNLDPSISWAASAQVNSARTGADLGSLTVNLAQAADFSTSHNWNISLFATAEQTAAWLAATKATDGQVLFDIKFFDTAQPDPVIHSETVFLHLHAPVTP
jgi:hypothetical protein